MEINLCIFFLFDNIIQGHVRFILLLTSFFNTISIISDADAYEKLTEDFIIKSLSEAMGEIDQPKLISEVIKLISNEGTN